MPTVPHIPTAAQLTQLATLQATVTSTKATLDAITDTVTGTLRAASDAYLQAVQIAKDYEQYIYGGDSKRGVIDEGNQSAV